MKILYFAFCLFLVSLYACKENETQNTEKEEKYIPEGMEAKYNNEYIKIVDTTDSAKPNKRAILGNAALNLGELKISLNNEEPKIINTFKKAYNTMSISAKGLRMRIQDMDYQQLSISLSSDNVFDKMKGSYKPGDFGSKNFVGELIFENLAPANSFTKRWKEGTLELLNFSPGLGTIHLKLDGKLEDDKTKEIEPISLEMNMRFDEVHSSIRPK